MAEAPAQQPSTLAWVDAVREQFASVIVGQQQLLNRLLGALITGSHVLIEGVPGLGKTLSIVTIARCLDASFRRVQFTPDLLPSDITGTLIYEHALRPVHAATGAGVRQHHPRGRSESRSG